MNIIIDTHIFLWALSDPEKIDPHRLDELQAQTNTIYVSSISIAEIAIKASLGKLSAEFNAIKMIEMCGFEQLDFRCRGCRLAQRSPLSSQGSVRQNAHCAEYFKSISDHDR
jgi:PIN domain nuclease of toxin-antitoxin system